VKSPSVFLYTCTHAHDHASHCHSHRFRHCCRCSRRRPRLRTRQRRPPDANTLADTFDKVAEVWKARNAPDAVQFARLRETRPKPSRLEMATRPPICRGSKLSGAAVTRLIAKERLLISQSNRRAGRVATDIRAATSFYFEGLLSLCLGQLLHCQKLHVKPTPGKRGALHVQTAPTFSRRWRRRSVCSHVCQTDYSI
jgi:hypothetical protein